MHTINEKADWMYVPVDQHNVWQKFAARSSGFITPGNFITLVGLGLVIWGVHELFLEQYLVGSLAIAAGRAFDLLDGIVAERTGTKCQVGEAVDTGADKIAILLCVMAIALEDLTPLYFIGGIIFINIASVILSGIARLRKIALHPSRSGKLFTAFSWLSIITYLYSYSSMHVLFINIELLALLLFALCVILGTHALYGYGLIALRKRS